MAKEIIAWCDWHLSEEDIRVAGDTVQVAFGASKPHELDLCEDCYKRLVEPLQSYLADHGRPVKTLSKKTPPPDERHRCPAPGCDKAYTHPNSLSKHLRRAHDTPSHQLTASDDTSDDTHSEPAAVESIDEPRVGHVCPTCERLFATPQGLGAHRNKAHGYRAGDDVA